MNVVIIGGGLGGLVLAWRLQQAGIAYTLFEADAQPGGNFRSLTHPAGYLLEAGPNSVQLTLELETLLAELDLTDDLIEPAGVSGRRYVLRGGRYCELPGSPPALLAGSFFGLSTKWRLLRELWLPPAAPNPTETVAAFFERRFGREILDYAVNPFTSGIYAGDPAQLLLHYTFPSLAALEQAHGSVLRGLIKSKTGGGRRRIVGLKNGLQSLPLALAARLTGYQPNTTVTGLTRAGNGGFWVEATRVSDPQGTAENEAGRGLKTHATHLALALPAHAAATLLTNLFPAAAAALAAVNYPPLSVVFSAYDRAAVAHPLDGFGALHPKVEAPYAAGSIWSSSLYPARVPAGQVLFTTFVGGVQYAEAAGQPETAQLAAVDEELRRLYGITAAPRWQGRYHWPRSIPQFDQYIGPAQAAVDALAPEGVVAVANWRAGVGIPDVLRRAELVARELISGF